MTNSTPLQVYRITATDPHYNLQPSLQITVNGTRAAVPAGVTAKAGDVLMIVSKEEFDRLEVPGNSFAIRKGT